MWLVIWQKLTDTVLMKVLEWLGLLDIERLELLSKLSGRKEVARATGSAAELTDATRAVHTQENPELV